MNNNNPPFKVICIDDFKGDPNPDNAPLPEKGKIYTVTAIHHFSKTDEYSVHYELSEFPSCYAYWVGSFAPIQENYSDATAEILEKFKQTNEVPDKVLTPEKVLN
jgi:hypothetical protein